MIIDTGRYIATCQNLVERIKRAYRIVFFEEKSGTGNVNKLTNSAEQNIVCCTSAAAGLEAFAYTKANRLGGQIQLARLVSVTWQVESLLELGSPSWQDVACKTSVISVEL